MTGSPVEEEKAEFLFEDRLEEMAEMEAQFFFLLPKMKIRLLTTNIKNTSKPSLESREGPRTSMVLMERIWSS